MAERYEASGPPATLQLAVVTHCARVSSPPVVCVHAEGRCLCGCLRVRTAGAAAVASFLAAVLTEIYLSITSVLVKKY
jgi:hypothetical protein